MRITGQTSADREMGTGTTRQLACCVPGRRLRAFAQQAIGDGNR